MRYRSKARRVLNVCWKSALVIVGIFCAILILIAVREQYDEHYGWDAHYWDADLSANICVHHFRKNAVRVYDREAGKYVTPRLKWVSGVPDNDTLTVFCDKKDRRGFLNVKTGGIIIEGKYKYAWVFSEGLAAVVEPGGKMGFIDKTGHYVIAPELDYIASHDYVFKHGVCCIQNREGNQGLLSREGEWVVPQEYSFISYIEEADMFVLTKDKKEGLIKNGSFEWVLPMEYDDISWVNAPSAEGLVLYKDFCSKHVALDGTVIDEFLIDDTEELKYMIKFNSDEADEYEISDRVIAFRVYGLYGVMDKRSGKVLVPARYGCVEMSSENILKCSLDPDRYDNFVLYDLEGNKITRSIPRER